MQTISEDGLFQRLGFENPWWSFTPETEIRFRHPPKRIFFPAFFGCVMKADDGQALVLAGPLRAGKTVLLRQLVAALIEKAADPKSVFYCSLTAPSTTTAELGKLVELFTTHHGHGPESELIFLFDEVQYVRNWQEALLEIAEAWPKARVVGAVSSAAPALTTGEVSSQGRISVFVLPPLTFIEFLRFRGSEEKLFGPEGGQAGQSLAVSQGVLRALNAEFHRYVNFGGFLEAVLPLARGNPAPTFIRDGVADRVLHKDLASLSGVNDARELNRLFALVAVNTGLEVTMEELAKAASTAKNTLRKYLDYLESAFLIRRLPRVDRQGRRFQRAVAFKVYLTSPCLYAALFGPVAPKSEVFPRLAETALVGQWLGSSAMADLAYASWRGGGIDLLSIGPESNKPNHVYEIDWADAHAGGGKGPKQLAGFVDGTNPAAKAIVLTRTTAGPAAMGGLDITMAPLSLYAYWLQRDPTLRNFHSKG